MTVPIRPSSVTKWTQCPTRWWLEDVRGWTPPLSEWTPHALVGTAIHAGLALWWQRKAQEPNGALDQGVYKGSGWEWVLDGPEGPLKAALRALQEGWPPEVEGLEVQRAAIERTMPALIRFCETEMREELPVLIEHPLGEDGHTTPDLVTRGPLGLVVTDYKTHLHVEPDRVKYRLEGVERVHQFQHYAWAVSQYLGEPVRLIRRLTIVLGPKVVVKAAECEVDGRAQTAWYTQAEEKWRKMWSALDENEQGDEVYFAPAHIWRNENACKPYGEKWPCPMYTACWECHGDEELMAKFYLRKEPK